MGSYKPKPTQERYGGKSWRPWHGARTSRKFEQHGAYIRLLTSGVQNQRLGGEYGKHRRNVDRTTPAWGTSKDPEASQLRTTVAADCLWLTGDYANTCRLRQCQLTAEQQPQHHATASFTTFRCATECKSRYLSYKKHKVNSAKLTTGERQLRSRFMAIGVEAAPRHS